MTPLKGALLILALAGSCCLPSQAAAFSQFRGESPGPPPGPPHGHSHGPSRGEFPPHGESHASHHGPPRDEATLEHHAEHHAEHHGERHHVESHHQEPPGDDLPGTVQDWQAWSELITVRNHPHNGHKDGFVFCALPKNGCTVWKQLLLRAIGSDHWDTRDKTLVHNPQASGLDLVGFGLPHGAAHRSDIVKLMGPRSKTYKAVLARDPVTRVLSSYLDRCVDMKEWWRCRSKTEISFPEVIERYEAASGDNSDVHFKNQSTFCGLQYPNYTKWDAVKPYEDFFESSKNILVAAGLWHFGSSGWGGNKTAPFGKEVQPMNNHIQEHHTSDLVCKFYTEDLLKRVHGLYWPDYQRFKHLYSIRDWMHKCGPVWNKKH